MVGVNPDRDALSSCLSSSFPPVEDSIENSGSSTATDKPYQCSVCERAFRRKQDIDRHRCVTTCQKH